MTKVKRGRTKERAAKAAGRAAAKTVGRNPAKPSKSTARPTSTKARGVATTRPVRDPAPTKAKRPAKRAAVKKAKAGQKGRKAGKVVAPVPRTVRIRELDPQQRCGPGTSVQHMFRVDENLGGRLSVHLVFFDRHGLYCEHGRGCPAVEDVRKSNRQLDRMTQGGMRA